jgi:hypothetical protein
MEIIIPSVIGIVVVVFIILIYMEVSSIRRLVVERTFPVWKPNEPVQTSKPIGQENGIQDRIRTGIKRPMTLPKSDEKLAELEQSREKNAGSEFG